MRACFFGASSPKTTPAQDSVALYRKDIGKTAFNATSGVEIGRIVDVEVTRMNGPEQIIFNVKRWVRIMNSQVSNVIVKDVPSTVAD